MEGTNIYKKILAFQKLGISVKKDGKNPHFKSSYATLNEVLDKVMKPLNDLQVIVLFTPEAEGLRTVIKDTESDTSIEGFMRYVGCNNAQNLLACNTYFRRGSLVSMLGLEDEDDDGNKAVQAEPKKEAPVMIDGVLQKAQDDLRRATTLEELQTVYMDLAPQYRKLTLKLKDELKTKLN